MPVRDIDRGYRRIKRDVKKLDGAYTKVGLPEDGDVESGNKRGSGRAPFVDMSELVVVGAANEFGTKRVPERSFLRSASDENRQGISALQEKMYAGVLTATIPLDTALATIGEFLTNKVRRKIQTLRIPANALSTTKKKGSTNPLIDIGQLVQSIQHEEVIP